MSAFQSVVIPVNRGGWPIIAGFAVAAAILAVIYAPLGWLGLVAVVWCVWFFRDPVRVTPARAGLVVSPADGIVSLITLAPPPPELEMGTAPRLRISIFLNIFNVHVNRVPTDGIIEKVHYHPGLFLNASLDKASEDNERTAMRLRLSDGRDLAFVQIAGLVARRIVCDLKAEQKVRAGERFGLIRFGSRMDVYLPEGAQPLVAEGQTAVAGETVLADFQSVEPARLGEVR